MKEKFERGMDKPSFFSFLLASFVIHVFLAVFFLTPIPLWDFFKKDKKVIPASIRVDMVALPDLPSENGKVKEKKEKPVLIPEKTPEKKKHIKRKEEETTKKKVKETTQKEKKETAKKDNSKQLSPNSKPEANKGNQLAKGAKEGEEILDSQSMEAINIYMSVVKAKIKSNWNLPKYLIDLNFSAQIEIRINDKGEMIYKQIDVSSGNELFDGWVLKAIENAAPYPPPPVTVKRLVQDGIVFTLSSTD